LLAKSDENPDFEVHIDLAEIISGQNYLILADP